MKTKKKLLIALLSATCLAAGAFGLAACKTEKGAQGDAGPQGPAGSAGIAGTAGKSAYELYCDSVPAGQTPLTEAEWLASLVGTNGVAGNGIESIELSQDGLSIVINFTDGSAPSYIPLPDTVTHKHAYGYKYDVIFPATDETEGLGYQTCTGTGCDHKEILILPKIKEVVFDDDEFAVELTESLEVGEKIAYSFDVPALENLWYPGTYEWATPVSLYFDGETDSDVAYKVVIDYNYHNNVSFNVDGSPVYEQQIFIEASNRSYPNSTSVYLDVDTPNPVSGAIQKVIITVERVVPDYGSIDLPLALTEENFGEEYTMQTTAGKDIYFTCTPEVACRLAFEFDSGVTLTYLGGDITGETLSESMLSGENRSLGASVQCYFKFTSASSTLTFTPNVTYALGSEYNPKTLDLNTTVTAEQNTWFKLDVPAGVSGNYTIATTSGTAYYEIYRNSTKIPPQDVETVESNVYVVTLQEGGTYYLKTINGDASFIVRPTTNDDKGYSMDLLADIVVDAPVEVPAIGGRYFKFEAATAGEFYVETANATIHVYKNANFSDNRVSAFEDGGIGSTTVAAGDILYISVNSSDMQNVGTVTVCVGDASVPVTHTVKVVGDDGHVFTSLNVTVNGSQYTTDANGEFTFSAVPDRYSVEIQDTDISGYSYTEIKIAKSFKPSLTTVVVNKNLTYEVTVTSGGTPVAAGITVSIYKGYSSGGYGGWSKLTEAVTDSNGKVTFSVPAADYQLRLPSSVTNYEIPNLGINDGKNVTVDTNNLSYELEVVPVLVTVPLAVGGGSPTQVTETTKYSVTVSSGGNYKFTVQNGYIDNFYFVYFQTTCVENGVQTSAGLAYTTVSTNGDDKVTEVTFTNAESGDGFTLIVVPGDGNTTVQVTEL